MEISSKISQKAPLLTIKDIAMFSGLLQNFDITKAKTALGFNPKNPAQAVAEAMHYLYANRTRF
jgi:dihydroflavonol-4-reductase